MIPMLRTAEQHRRIAEVCEEAARDQSISAAKRALLAERAALFKELARRTAVTAEAAVELSQMAKLGD
jgi:hypothetical protein